MHKTAKAPVVGLSFSSMWILNEKEIVECTHNVECYNPMHLMAVCIVQELSHSH